MIQHFSIPRLLLLACISTAVASPTLPAQAFPGSMAVVIPGGTSRLAGGGNGTARTHTKGLKSGGVLVPPTTDLNDPDAILESNQASSGSFLDPLMGASVSSAGDVNGDGFEDVVVGAPGWDAAGGLFDEGAVFVFLGSATGVVGRDPGSAHARIISDEAASHFGSSVASAGDVNGDGYDDLLVGAPLADASGLSVSGAVYVFHGGPGGITAFSPADADAVLECKQIEGHFGESVASAGDVNGDGFDDVIIGADLYGKPFGPSIPNQGSGRQGAAFVFLGSAQGLVGNTPAQANASLVAWTPSGPAQVNAHYGQSVASAGDVNNDGYDDVIVGCPAWNQAKSWPGVPGGDPPSEGAAFVFLGSANGITGSHPGTADGRIEGGQLDGHLGHDVASAGDVNGDGYADIVIGAVGFPAGDPLLGAEEGAVFVFHGSASGITATGPQHANATFQGSELAEWVGQSVSSAGDVDRDGYDDILFSARVYPGSQASEGVAYVFRGGPGGVTGSSLSDAHLRMISSTEQAFLGSTVAGGLDVDGDPWPDLILGVTGFSNGQLFEGAGFVYRGRP